MENFGRYEIKRELGAGGMAKIYLAYDPNFKREVAIKVLPEQFLQDPGFRARFEREARTIAALEHPAIVPVYDYGEERGRPYLVMRYMAGGSLADRLLQGPVALLEGANIFNRIAPALDKAHAVGVIHRDLKPANILFDQDGNAYISDFGIAKVAQLETSTLTGNQVVGTPAYMSPEQARGDPSIDGRSDIYAMGAILYQMLTGELPYQAETPLQLAVKQVTEPVPRILDAKPDLPVGCDNVIKRAMAKNKADRFSSAKDLVQDLLTTAQTDKPTLIAFPEIFHPEPTIKDQKPERVDGGIGRLIHIKTGMLLLLIVLMGAIGYFLIDMMNINQNANISVLMNTDQTQSPKIDPSPRPSSTSTRVVTSIASQFPTATKRNTPTEQPKVTITPIIEMAYLTLDKNYHCRGGPSTGYEILRDFQQGTKLLILGRDTASEWFLIKIDDPSTHKKLCWIYGDDYPGDISHLPICTWIGDGYTEDQNCR